jgi:mRNA-degrading endonuclease RelE of RelBE toxin-antitoxin system
MPWEVRLAKLAQKNLRRIHNPDHDRIVTALGVMRSNPFQGDVELLQNQPTAYRRRVGNWRILFDVYRDRQLVLVASIKRRSTTTYRKRK